VVAALREAGIDTRCIAYGAPSEIVFDGTRWTAGTGVDIPEAARSGALMLDSYCIDVEKLESPALLSFHDPGSPETHATVVVAAGSAGRSSGSSLRGLQYACLRPSLWEAAGKRTSTEVQRILVCAGAADPDRLATPMAQAALSAGRGAAVRVARGLDAPMLTLGGVTEVKDANLVSELAAADLVVTLGGQTALEAARLGTPSIVIPAMPNQEGNAQRLAEAGAAVIAPDVSTLSSQIELLVADPDRRKDLSRAARAAVDGQGARRVAARVAALLS
jgi:spore coat polysaccharide biosynthesis predicted glycosyltransferase SpsG